MSLKLLIPLVIIDLLIIALLIYSALKSHAPALWFLVVLAVGFTVYQVVKYLKR